MSDLRTAAQQALEALKVAVDHYHTYHGHPGTKFQQAITNLRAALAQQDEPLNLRDPAVQKRLATQWGYVPAAQAEPVEPVAWMFELARNFNLEGYGGWEKRITEYRPNTPEGSVRNVTPLYTAPPQRKPLPKHDQHCVDVPGYGLMAVRLVRAVERAHGIGEQS